MKKLNTGIIILCLGVSAFSLQAGDRWHDYLDNDLRQLRKNTGLHTLLYAGGWLTGMYLLSDFDEQLSVQSKSFYRGDLVPYFDAIDHVGNAPYSIPGFVGFAGLTLLGTDKKLQDAAWTSVEAAAANAIVIALGKFAFGRSRPDENRGPHFFRPFTGLLDSFPSGHASTAFALITPWIVYYPRPYMYILYIIPVSTAIARVIFDRHWTTDVLTGSMIGFLIGYNLARWHKDRADVKGYYGGAESTPLSISLSIPLYIR